MYFALDSVHATENDLVSAFNKRVAQNRMTGKWVEEPYKDGDVCRRIRCSECGLSFIVGFNVPYRDWIEKRNYCQQCGAEMEQN